LGKHVTTIAIGETVQGIAHTPGAIWVAYNKDPGMVARVDTHSNQVTVRIQVGKSPVGAAAEDDAVWIVNNGDDTVSRVDPGTSKVVATIPVGKKPLEVAIGASAAWVTNSGGASVSRIDRATNQVFTIGGIGSEPSGIAFSQGAVLATDYRSDRVVRIDPQTNAVSGRFSAGLQSNFILPDGDAVWLNDQNERAVLRLNLSQPDRGPFKIQAGIGKMPTGLAVDNHELWVANWGDDTLTAIDLRGTEAQARVLPSGLHPLVILAAEGALWFTNAGDGSVLRLDP
jgi:YVTN family beta-propeller protein